MFSLSKFSYIFCVIILLASCSSDERPAENKPAPSDNAATEKKPATANDMRLDDLKAQYERIESYAASHPRELQMIITQLDSFKPQAEGTNFEKKAEDLAAKAQERFDEDARNTYEKLKEQAQGALTAGRAREALEVLGEYPAEFNSTEWQKKIDELSAPIEQEAEADRKFDIMTERVNEALEARNPEAALEIVKKYPESMRTGPRKTEWEKRHRELSMEVSDLEEKRRIEENLPWDELFSGGSMERWSAQAGEWRLEDELIFGECLGDSQGFIYCGTESAPWDNFILELEFKIVKGEYLVLGIRGKNEDGRSVFDQITFGTDNFPPGKFHKVTVEVRADVYTIRPEGSAQTFTQKAEPGYSKGPICFFIVNDSQVLIRKVRIKHLK